MNIAIYCGSSFGNKQIYQEKALEIAKALKKYKFNMVYGGSIAGIMGIVSNEALKLGLEVTGVITYNLEDKEIANKNLKTLYKVETMRERKAMMEKLSDAFIALPGGYGTFEEIFEIMSNTQIGMHNKPCAFYNVNGYYNNLIMFLQNCVDEGFLTKRHFDMLIFSDDIDEIFQKIINYIPPKSKWEDN